MFKKTLKLLSILLIAFTISAGIASAGTVNLNGYAWSENIGWVSFNGTNGGNVTLSTTTPSLGTISGYAWSENIGWISFQDGDISHPDPSVNLSGGQVSGWARACAGTINSDCASADRADGWDGWIELSGTDHSTITGLTGTATSSLGVSFNKDLGSFSGYAWGSDVVGWLDFGLVLCGTACGGTITPPPPTPSCTLVADPVSTSQINVVYTINNDKNAFYKLKESSVIRLDFSTNNFSPYTGTYNATGLATNSTHTYALFNSSNIQCGNSVTATTLSSNPPGGGTGKMWLNNDSAKLLTSMKVLVGRTAEINWELPSGYSNCKASGDTWFNSPVIVSQPNNDSSTTPVLAKGIYDLNISCLLPSPINLGPVRIIVTDPTIREN